MQAAAGVRMLSRILGVLTSGAFATAAWSQLKRFKMKLIIVLAMLAISTTASLAINDERPVIFDVEAERRQCLDLPEIKHQARDPVRACEYLVSERARLETVRAECLQKEQSAVLCKAIIDRIVKEYWPGITNKALIR
jgi:hypothetical protein